MGLEKEIVEQGFSMCICPKCGRDGFTHCVCDEDAEVCGIKDITCDENMTNDELDD